MMFPIPENDNIQAKSNKLINKQPWKAVEALCLAMRVFSKMKWSQIVKKEIILNTTIICFFYFFFVGYC